MIKKEKVDGVECTVVYLTAKGLPCDKKVAKRVKVIYPDGRIRYGSV